MRGKGVKIGACILADDMDRMVRFYRDTLGFQTQWTEGNFAEFETASGELSFFMYSRKAFAEAIGERYLPPEGINQTFEIAMWLPRFADVDEEYPCILEAGEEEGLYIADVDLRTLRAYRQSEVHGNAYRRPEKYGLLVSEKIEAPFMRADRRK